MSNDTLPAVIGALLEVLIHNQQNRTVPTISPFLQLGPDGTLLHLEVAEKSETARGLLQALWFDGSLSVLLARPDGSGARLWVKPHRCIASGAAFQQHYRALRARRPDLGLASVWELHAVDWDTFDASRWAYDESVVEPFFTHLDRLPRATPAPQ